jgi:hypothetical protein
MKITAFYTILFLFFQNLTQAQVVGKVTDVNGEALPFASVYVKGTSTGTTTNVEGEYDLKLESGSYALAFQYVGYQQKTVEIEVENEPLKVDVVLEKEAFELGTIEVLANAEDPAYPIIRKAIAKREYYQMQVKEYTCEAYVKGNVKILDAPEKIMGQEVGDLEGNLDSLRKGIVYLSESESILHHREPDLYKEIMVSSKVSGNNQGFSFNNAASMDLDFYDKHTYMGRNIVSPIANSAFTYYKYKLMGTVFDEDGRLINKIEVIPKRAEDPVMGGIIYIVEDSWNIKDADVFITGKSAHAPFFDTLYMKQTYVKVAEPDVWRIFSRSFSLTGGFFGFKYGGSFVAVYSEYDLQPNFEKDFFDNEILKVEREANDKDSLYWLEARPIPLTEEEEVDYVIKDSIREVRESKVWLDSVDNVKNKFKILPTLLGQDYTFNRTYERQFFTIENPLSSFLFNTVQGWNADLKIKYRKEYDKEGIRYWKVGTKLNYGFTEEKLRIKGDATYKFNSRNFARIYVEGGQEIIQFNQEEPIGPVLNSLYTYFFRKNYAKYFEQTYAEIAYREEVANGVLMRGYLNVSARKQLQNTNLNSAFYEDSRVFTANLPANLSGIVEDAFADNQAITFGLKMRLRWKQKYLNYPDRKFLAGSALPDLWIEYRRGIPLNSGSGQWGSSDANYDFIQVQILENYLQTGLLGWMEFNLKAGTFFNDDKVAFPDYKHFNGSQIEIGNPNDYNNAFFGLPYYEYSTQNGFLEGHFQQHFDGFLLDKIPLLRKLQFTTVLGAHFLYTEDKKDYLELSVGLDNIGWELFRFIRVDGFAQFREGKYDGVGFMIGFKTP